MGEREGPSTMNKTVELISLKSKVWGIVPLPDQPTHYHTGYDREWNGPKRWDLFHSIGDPKSHMMIGQNVIINGLFRITNWSRGRSAANFHGHFHGEEEVTYELSMDGMGDVIRLIQDQVWPIRDGFLESTWTIAKQGTSFFLAPHTS